jgi:PKD repeat protein
MFGIEKSRVLGGGGIDVDFQANLLIANAGQTINFTDLSAITPDSWSWNFNNEGQSILQNPSFTFLTAGQKTITLFANKGNKSGIAIKTLYIQINASYFSDLFGMPDACYSTRKLTPTATNCIRVRRSSDNAEQNIGFTANAINSPIDTVALLAFVGAGDGFVTIAYNQNISGTNFTETDGSFQPRIVSGGVVELHNALTSIYYRATSRMMNNSIHNQGLISAFRVQNTSDTSYVVFNSSSSNYSCVASQGDGTTVISSLPTPIPRYYINGNIPSPFSTRGQVYTAQNGSKIITELISTRIFTPAQFQISGYSGFNIQGDIPELIVYFTDKSVERIDIEKNINNYWNVF